MNTHVPTDPRCPECRICCWNEDFMCLTVNCNCITCNKERCEEFGHIVSNVGCRLDDCQCKCYPCTPKCPDCFHQLLLDNNSIVCDNCDLKPVKCPNGECSCFWDTDYRCSTENCECCFCKEERCATSGHNLWSICCRVKECQCECSKCLKICKICNTEKTYSQYREVWYCPCNICEQTDCNEFLCPEDGFCSKCQ